MTRITRILKYLFWRFKWYLVLIIFVVSLFCVYQYTHIFQFRNINISPSGQSQLEYLDLDLIRLKLNWVYDKKYLSLNVSEIENEILKEPFANSLVITKIFPDTLLIYIEEKKPFISLDIENKKCIVLTSSAFVLDIVEEGCGETLEKYSSILVSSDDPKLNFEMNTPSTYYQVNDISKITKVLNEHGFGIESFNIKEGIVTVSVKGKKKIILSLNQNLEKQLTRLVAILPQIEKNRIKYSTIDVRYNRPVVKK